jgi:putative nucleotidyltransferase with HDIG domain
MDPAQQIRAAEDFMRRLAAALRAAQLYSPTHPLVGRALGALVDSLTELLAGQPSVVVGIIGQDVIVGDTALPRAAESMGEIMRRLKHLGIERLSFDRGITPDELTTLALTIANPERAPGQSAPGATASDPLAVLASLAHVRVGRLQVTVRGEEVAADMTAIRRLYSDAVDLAESMWDLAKAEGMPDPQASRAMVDLLAQAVSQNRTALIALTALKDYDNYTFTHMVNVSILTMAQARALVVDGAMLRELGLAALMHDIGKVRTPADILQKPETLTDDEFAIMRMHVVDGAEILRRTPELPAIAPVIAFEHHLRLDGSGYPIGVARSGLNLGTMLCGIADVYDAMRSERAYHQSFPTERILAVLRRNDGRQFDQHLVRRFIQLLGIYPPGSLVRLDSGALAVVLQIHAPDPYRPRVRVITSPTGERLPTPHDLSLWESVPDTEGPIAVLSPVNPAEFGVDPLTYL